MARLEDILRGRLVNLLPTKEGWVAQCPACAAAGHDLTGKNHLQIRRNGAFYCVRAHVGDTDHNRAIRAFIYEGADATTLAALEAEFIDPDPKIVADTIYPEEMLTKLVPDHRYWMGRGISEEVLRRLEGGLAPEGNSKVSGRYVFPIRDHITGRIIGWTGRLVSDASFGPTHKHLVKTSRAVYPLWYTKDAIFQRRKVVFVEGVGDQLACMTAGIDYVIDLLGLHLNSRMLGFLVSAGITEAVISTNNDTLGKASSDEAGNKAAVTIRAKLEPYIGAHRIKTRLPQTRKDWCKTLEDKTGELEVFRAELEGKPL